MSKLLWKFLIISPAVLGATLVVSGDGVRAADGTSSFATDSKTPTQAAQPQMAKTPTPEVLSLVKDAQASRLATIAAPSDLVTQDTPVLSTAPTQVPMKPSPHPQGDGVSGVHGSLFIVHDSEVKAPDKVAATLDQLSSANPEAKLQAPTSVMPATDTTVAQVTPAAPDKTDNLLDQIKQYNRDGNSNSQSQVTNVTQLRDVSPNDWAYEALRSLVERYGCIAGYPDGTYRGNRALSRYEFAAGLNACLQQVERLIASNTSDFVRKEDLATLQRLIDEFRTELTTLGTRVDKLEGRVAFLETHQFSTTTKLSGEAIFAITDEFNRPVSNNTVFQDRVRLTFNTSFTGRDRLATRLSAGNAQQFNFDNNGFLGGSTPLSEGQQTFSISNTGNIGNNSVNLDWLAYYFNFGSSKVYVAATGGIHSDYAPTLNPYFEDYDGGNGALSTFASESPIYRIGGGAGAALSFGVGPLRSILGPSTITVGYLAGSNTFGANNPNEKAGLFDGDYAALGQLNVNVGDRLGIGATFVHAYHNTGTPIFDLGGGRNDGTGFVVGSFLANNPGLATNISLPQTPIVTNSYGVEAAFRLSNNISISGFGSYTNAILINQGTGDIWSYGGGIAFTDFGKPGNVLGLFAGVEPTLRGLSSSVRPAGGFNHDNVWHFEGFYKYRVSDNISVTPGIIWITAPDQNENNQDAVIGTLRTTFTF